MDFPFRDVINIIADYTKNGEDLHNCFQIANCTDAALAGQVVKEHLESSQCEVQLLCSLAGRYTTNELQAVACGDRTIDRSRLKVLYVSKKARDGMILRRKR